MGPKHLGVEPRQLRGRLHVCDLCTLTLSGVEVTPHSTMGLPQNIHPLLPGIKTPSCPFLALHDPGQPDAPAALTLHSHPVFKAASKSWGTEPTCTESYRPSTEVPTGRLHTLEKKHHPLIWHRRVPGWYLGLCGQVMPGPSSDRNPQPDAPEAPTNCGLQSPRGLRCPRGRLDGNSNLPKG